MLDQTVTNNIENAKYKVTDTEIVISANDGYKFSEAPTGINYYAPLDMRTYVDFTLSADGKTATCLLSDMGANTTEDYAIELNGSVVEETTPPTPVDYVIVNNIQNATFAVSGDVLTITAATGFKFETPPTAFQTLMVNFECVLSSDGKTATLNLAENGYNKTDEITLTGNTVADSTPQPTYAIVNDIANTTYALSGSVLTVSANDGYKFTTAPTADNIDSGASLIDRYDVSLILSEDGKKATVDLKHAADADGEYIEFPIEYEITLKGTVEAVTTYEGFYGSVNVYEVSNENLKSFAGLRFTDGGDLGKYVAKLFRLFVNVGATADTVIKCGDTDTKIQAKTPLNDTVILDFGNVYIPFHNSDVTDYNSTIQLFLPFVGFVNIDTKFIGENINLTYEVNVIQGEAVARLSCNGVVFDVHECRPCSDLLYKMSDTNTIGILNFESRYMYGLQPYIMVTWNTSKNEYVNNSDCKRVVIGSAKGFARYSEITEIASPQMTADEKTMIINQLNTGVYVE